VGDPRGGFLLARPKIAVRSSARVSWPRRAGRRSPDLAAKSHLEIGSVEW